MSDHEHDWVLCEPWRVCSRCVLVQHHDGKRWRKAPKAIQDYVRARVMMALIHHVVTHPGVAERIRRYSEGLQEILASVTAP